MSRQTLPYSSLISTGEQCRETDRKTIEEFGVDGFTLMETAACGAARQIGEREPSNATGLFLCGKGHNAGDALAVARYLAIHRGHQCHICFAAGTSDLSPDTQKNLELLEKMTGRNMPIHIYESLDHALESVDIVDYLVDGMLGTGLSAEVRSPLKEAITTANEFECTVYAMDIPSGLHTDSGKPLPESVTADVTFSFGSLKPGFFFQDGPAYTGTVIPCNLTFPPYLRKGVAQLLTPDIDIDLPEIHRSARHKYDGGVVYVAAGSEGLTGAAILASKAAWKSGAGAVFLFAPKGLLPIYEMALPEVIKIPVGSVDDKRFKPAHVQSILEKIKHRKGALLVGPGLGVEPDTIQFVQQLVHQNSSPTVIDADAIRAVQGVAPADFEGAILTPHPGELQVLSGTRFDDDFERLKWVSDYSSTHSVYVVSKGSPTITGSPQELPMITGYDTTAFARAGFGDLLSGTIIAYLAITGEKNLAIMRSLIDGYQKNVRFTERTGTPPGPGDLL